MDTTYLPDSPAPDKAAWSHYWACIPSGGRGCLPGLPAQVAEVFEARWQAFFHRLPEGARVLDLGTGDGAVLRVAAHARTGLRLVGVDYADHVPEGGPGLEFMSGIDFEALPFEAQSFDAVCSQFALEYAERKAVSELLRVLRPDGMLMVVAHHAGSPILEQNRRRLAALDALMSAGGLLHAVEQIVLQGRGRDKAAIQELAAMLQQLRRAHASQGVVEEIAGLTARLMNQPDALSQLAQLRAGAGMEQLRLRALGRAALDEPAARRLAADLARERQPVQCSPLCGPAAGPPLAWHIEDHRSGTLPSQAP